MGEDIPKSRGDCEALDKDDPLAAARKAFVLPEDVIYLDGHSLGPATHVALARVKAAAENEWADGLIRSWNTAGWIDLPRRVGARIAGLIGVEADEVIVTDSVTVNLFKLATAALRLANSRRIILIEDGEFPTDQYVAGAVAQLTGAKLVTAPAERIEETMRLIGGGVLVRSVVNYRTAELVDVERLEAVARETGGVIVWDLSHATGVIDLNLGAAGARLAAGCTYKFLNGGPGAPAFLYVRRDLTERLDLRSPISGWFGHADPFAFDADYAPTAGVARFAAGTPGILSLVALDGALDAFDGVDVRVAMAKARRLGDIVIARAEAMGLEPISPRDPARRGGHVSVRHEDGYAVVQALIARGVIPDFRAPDAMRFGVSPLFLRYTDVWEAMDQLDDILATRAWDRPEFRERAKVT